ALSALGILISDVVKDHSRTVLLRVKALPRNQLEEIYRELQTEIEQELKKEQWQGKAVIKRNADLRSRGRIASPENLARIKIGGETARSKGGQTHKDMKIKVLPREGLKAGKKL